MECLTTMAMVCVKSELVGLDAVQIAPQEPMLFPGQKKFREKLDDPVGETFSTRGQQPRQVQHVQLFHHLLELP
jgi:hypothetical protein